MGWFGPKARGRCQSRIYYLSISCCEHGGGGELEVGAAELVQFATVGVGREGGGGIPHVFGDEIWKSNPRESDLAVVGVGGRGGGGWGEFGSVENGADGSRGGGDDSQTSKGGGFAQEIITVARASHPCLKNSFCGDRSSDGAINIFGKIFPTMKIE